MTERACRVCGGWHDLEMPWPAKCFVGVPVARSDLPGPMIISDCMDATMNMADGRRYDSKRAYQKAVRAAGCEIVGNETVKAPPKQKLDDPIKDIKRALEIHGTPRS